MFDLDTSDETVAVTELGRNLGLNVLFPAAKEAERDGLIPQAVRQSLFESGLTVAVPEAFGGGGVPSCSTQVTATEALSYGDAGLTLASVWSGSAAAVISMLGTSAQQQQWLPRFATDASAHGGVALYEGQGRSPSESSTTLTPTSDGRFTLRGTKLAVAGADQAEPIVVIGNDPSGSLRAVIVSAGHPGVTIRAPGRHIALDAARLCSVDFDCVVDASALLGGATEADIKNLTLSISRHRLHVAAALLGSAQRSIDYASTYANERIAFGKPISAFQGVSFLLAEAAIRVGAARVEMLDVANQIDAGDATRLEQATTNAVNYAGSVATQTARDAMQVLGGHGFITDHPVEIWYRTTAALATLDFDPLCSAFEPAL